MLMLCVYPPDCTDFSTNGLGTSLNFHPASIRRDPRMYDEKERIIYIFGRTWTDNEGRERPWTELYTPEERACFTAALD